METKKSSSNDSREVAEQIQGWPYNHIKIENQREYIAFFTRMRKFFGGVKSATANPFGDREEEKYGPHISFPATDENQRPMIVFSTNWMERKEGEGVFVLLAYSKDKIYHYKEVVDFANDYNSYTKMRDMVDSAKKFMGGEIDVNSFSVIRKDNTKRFFPKK